MTQLIAQSPAHTVGHQLTPFSLGVGVHLDTAVDSTVVDASTVARLRELDVARYRVNVRWDTIMRGPDQQIDYAAIDRLADTVELLLDAGVEPLVALDNVSLPTSLEDDGGWRNDATSWAYGDFVGAVGARLGDLVDEWLTFAAAQPRRFDPSMTSTLLRAQADAATILRAHAPNAILGASVDISQFDPTLTGAAAESTQEWLAHLASPRAATSFVAVNIDQRGVRSPDTLDRTMHTLANALPGRSFVWTEAHATVTGPERSRRLVTGDTSERQAVVDGLFESILELRADQIDICGTFAWPFSGSTPTHDQLEPDTLEVYRRIKSSGIL